MQTEYKSKHKGKAIDNAIDYFIKSLPTIISNIFTKLQELDKKKASVGQVPTKTSQLLNDSDYIKNEDITIKSITLNGNKKSPDNEKNIDIPLVSTDSDGLMSKADKTKLDGIKNGAEKNRVNTVSVNGYEYVPASDKNINLEIGIFDKEVEYSSQLFNRMTGFGIYKINYCEVDENYADERTAILLVRCKQGLHSNFIGVTQTLIDGEHYLTRNGEYDGDEYLWTSWHELTEDYATSASLKELSDKTVKYTDAGSVIGQFTVTPVISGVTAKFMFDLIYPFDYDGYKIFVKDAETSGGIIAKGKGFVTAPAIFDGDDIKVKFYSGTTEVFAATVKKMNEISHAKNGSIKYGALCAYKAPSGGVVPVDPDDL